MTTALVLEEVRGTDRIREALTASAERMSDQRPLWEKADARIGGLARQQFASFGSLTGGWAPHSAEYIDAAEEAGRGVQMLGGTGGAIHRALVDRQAAGALSEMGKTEFLRGIDPQGPAFMQIFHQAGARSDLPQREALVWREEDTEWLKRQAETRAAEGFESG